MADEKRADNGVSLEKLLRPTMGVLVLCAFIGVPIWMKFDAIEKHGADVRATDARWRDEWRGKIEGSVAKQERVDAIEKRQDRLEAIVEELSKLLRKHELLHGHAGMKSDFESYRDRADERYGTLADRVKSVEDGQGELTRAIFDDLVKAKQESKP